MAGVKAAELADIHAESRAGGGIESDDGALDLHLRPALVESLDQVLIHLLHCRLANHNDAVGIDVGGDGGVAGADGTGGLCGTGFIRAGDGGACAVANIGGVAGGDRVEIAAGA